jgi:hypothetical protein
VRQLSINARARRIVALLGILSVLLPIYGPFIDSGYAENLPGHDHVILDGGSLAAHRAAGASSDDGVVATPGADDGGIYAIVVAAAAAALSSHGATPTIGLLRRLSPYGNALVPFGWSVAPVLPPPKPLVV